MAFCTHCGASLPTGAAHCPNCGRALYNTYNVNNDAPVQRSIGGMVAWSVVTLLLCTIPGIISLVQVCGVNSCATKTEQEKKLSSAKTWNIVGTVLGILALIGSLAQAGAI